MSELVSDLRKLHEELLSAAQDLRKPGILKPLKSLENAANEIGKSSSRSWFGYQSRVYYHGLKPPPPGSHFSSEWGLQQAYTVGSTGDWEEFPAEFVEKEIRRRAGNPDLSEATSISEQVRELVREKRDDILSILRTAKHKRDESFLNRLIEEAERTRAFTCHEVIAALAPSGQLMSRDALAMSQGLWPPPHLTILAEVMAIESPREACEQLAAITRRAFSHLERMQKNTEKTERIGTNVFIGHGRSKEWKDLKDFIQDRMRLPWDEFNRVAVAGIPNTVRLSTMLDAAAIAFLVLTAEDERADGGTQARMNVIHEAGLFQGRLGFSRAIVMLEDGCEQFSNVEGLGQIRFPKSNIKAAFHDVQLVLEREGLVEAPEG